MDARPLSTVFLIEDDVSLLSALTFAFDIEGYAVQAFSSAESARAADIADADCLVVDYGLPDGNGLDFLKVLRAGGCIVPAVLITSHPADSVLRLAGLIDVVVVEKPLLSDDLVDTVQRLAPANVGHASV